MSAALARSQTVDAPDGRTWTVRRVILPRIPRLEFFRRRDRRGEDDSRWWDALDPSPLIDGLDELGWVVLALAALAVLIFFVLPVLVFLVDVVLVLATAAGAIAVRILFKRPWKILATTHVDIGEAHAWAVIGTHASAQALDAVARELQAGRSPISINPGPPINP